MASLFASLLLITALIAIFWTPINSAGVSNCSNETLIIRQLRTELEAAQKKSASDESVMESLRMMVRIHENSAEMYKRSMESVKRSFDTLKGQVDTMVGVMSDNSQKMNGERTFFGEKLSKTISELNDCREKNNYFPIN